MDKQPGFDRLTFRNNVLRKDGNLPVNSMDIITVGFGIYGNFTTVRTVDISHNTFVISTTQRQNWSFNVIDLMARPQVINWNDNVFLRFVEDKDAAPSGIVFVSKIDPVDEKTDHQHRPQQLHVRPGDAHKAERGQRHRDGQRLGHAALSSPRCRVPSSRRNSASISTT